MSFEIFITESVKQKIARWNLPPDLLFRIEDQLYGELAESPIRHLECIPKPSDILQYSFCVSSQDEEPRSYLFVFDVAYTVDEEGLVIRDCHYISDQ